MGVIGPPIEVEPPGYESGFGGLLDTFEPIAMSDPRWELGYTFRPRGGCGRGSRWAPCSDVTKPNPAPGSSGVNRTFRPFVIIGPYECSTYGTMNDEVLAEFIRDAVWILDRDRELQVSEEFWYGTLGNQNGWENLWLTGPTMVPLSTSPVPSLIALGALQDALSACNSGSVGVIHAPDLLVTKWVSQFDVNLIDGYLRDSYGNYIVAGAGYSGSGPSLDQLDSITVDAAGGNWTISVTSPIDGTTETTGNLLATATAAQVATALLALSFIDSVIVTGGPGAAGGGIPYAITWTGALGFQAITASVNNVSLAGGAATVTLTTLQVGGSSLDPSGVILWAYATGLVDIRLGEIEIVSEKISEVLDRKTNDVLVRAEQFASAAFDGCCHFGIPVNICVDCCEPAPTGGGGE